MPASGATLATSSAEEVVPADEPHAHGERTSAAPTHPYVSVLHPGMMVWIIGLPHKAGRVPRPFERPAAFSAAISQTAARPLRNLSRGSRKKLLRGCLELPSLPVGKKLAPVADMGIRRPLVLTLFALEVGVACDVPSNRAGVDPWSADFDASTSGASGEGPGEASSNMPVQAAVRASGEAGSAPSCDVENADGGSFVSLAVPLGKPLDPNASDPLPLGDAGSGTSPPGWHFYQIDGAVCRDGSSNGIYVQYSAVASKKLMIYLEGGGACMSPHFCDHNPANIHQFFHGGPTQGESFSAVLLSNMTDFVLQQPYTTGIFDDTNGANPFQGWNRVYVPYCTGDVHFGAAPNVMMDDGLGNTKQQQFVGYSNMQRFIARVVPTFPDVDQVVLTGTSAGGLGAALNYGLVQDSFGSVPVTVVDDSGPAFLDPMYLATCLQKELRELWGWDGSLPSDCQECRQPDGGGLMNVVQYWLRKYPRARIGLISSIHDQIFRLFYSAGTNDCASSDPNILSGLGLQGGDPPDYPGPLFAQALDSLRTTYSCTGSFGSYYIGGSDPDASTSNGSIDTLHMHTFRDRFYAPLAGGVTLAKWTSDFVSGAPLTDVGP